MSLRVRLALTALFVAVRLAALVTAPHLLYNIEELYTGTISHELLVGRVFPLFDYQYEHYCGGSLVVGILGQLFFALLGHRFLALKMLALAWSTVSFLIWLALFDRTLTRRGALAAGMFLCFAPIWFVRQGLMAWGNHSESTLWTGLMLLFFLRGRGWRREGDAWAWIRAAEADPRRLALCGVVTGFSIYFCYTSLVGIGALGLTWCALDRTLFPRRGLRPFLAGALVGLLPWFAYSVPRGFIGLSLYGDRLGAHIGVHPQRAISKSLGFLLSDFPRSLAPAADLPMLHAFGAVAMYAAVVASGCVVLIALLRRRAAGLPIATAYLVYPALFAAAYALIDVGAWSEATGVYAYRFFAPLVPFLAGLFGAAVSVVPGLLPLTALPVALALASLVASVTGAEVGSQMEKWRGYSYRWLGVHLGVTQPDVEWVIERADGIRDPSDRRFMTRTFWLGAIRYLAIRAAESGKPIPSLDSLREMVAAQSAEAGQLGREALDAEVRLRGVTGQPGPSDWTAWVDAPGAGGAEERPVRAGAAAAYLCLRDAAGLEDVIARLDRLPAAERMAATGGLGLCAALVPERIAPSAVAARLGAADQPAFFRGFGFGAGWEPDREAGVPLRYRRDYACGRIEKLEEQEAEDPARLEVMTRRLRVEMGRPELDCR